MKGVSQTTHLNLEYTSRAGIAQLVEQATENRRVPSSNLGPGTFKTCLYGFFFMNIYKFKFLVINSTYLTDHAQN